MAYDKKINAGDVAGKLLDALRQDKKNIEMDAVIKAEIDQPRPLRIAAASSH